jgi:RNA polymerase sigma-70 factor (ECF subfamily)
MSVDAVNELPSRPSPGAAGAHLGELYASHSRLVYGICRMLLRDPDEAEDATQQVFLSAYKNLLTGTQVRDPAAWLGTIARNTCRNRAVARMREPVASAEAPTQVSPAADEQASGREQAAALYAELATLPQKQREAVVLRDLYGLRYDEVAAALGTSRPAVEALLFRGRRRLQVRLRPGFAAGVIVVPLAVQESIAYAIPGFASTAVPAGAAATAIGIPLLAKLAATGAAVGIAGSAGYVAEKGIRDSPARPAAQTRVEAATPVPVKPTLAVVKPLLAASLLPPAPAATPVAATRDENEEDERGGDESDDKFDDTKDDEAEAKDDDEREDAHDVDKADEGRDEKQRGERDAKEKDDDEREQRGSANDKEDEDEDAHEPDAANEERDD